MQDHTLSPDAAMAVRAREWMKEVAEMSPACRKSRRSIEKSQAGADLR